MTSKLQVTPTAIHGVFIIEPKVFGDERGWFAESFNAEDFAAATGLNVQFVQDNHSKSAKGVLRGLHYQIEHAQGKLVRVTSGEVYDVAVDMRKESPTFGQWAACHLSAENARQFWVPPGFAHGFLVLSESAEFLYKTTDFYAPQSERCIAWDEPSIGVDWHYAETPQLSAKDLQGAALVNAEVFE